MLASVLVSKFASLSSHLHSSLCSFHPNETQVCSRLSLWKLYAPPTPTPAPSAGFRCLGERRKQIPAQAPGEIRELSMALLGVSDFWEMPLEGHRRDFEFYSRVQRGMDQNHHTHTHRCGSGLQKCPQPGEMILRRSTWMQFSCVLLFCKMRICTTSIFFHMILHLFST